MAPDWLRKILPYSAGVEACFLALAVKRHVSFSSTPISMALKGPDISLGGTPHFKCFRYSQLCTDARGWEQRDINSNSTDGKFKELNLNHGSSVAVRDSVVELNKDEVEVVHFTKML